MKAGEVRKNLVVLWRSPNGGLYSISIVEKLGDHAKARVIGVKEPGSDDLRMGSMIDANYSDMSPLPEG